MPLLRRIFCSANSLKEGDEMFSKKYLLNDLILDAKNLSPRTQILLSGTLYTARDAAHKKIIASLDKNEEPPFPLKNSAIYYCGPSPAAPGQIIGACGPTTSLRMDIFTPRLLKEGVKVFIGKGKRADFVMRDLKKHNALYLSAAGGIAALLSQTVRKAQLLCFKELGTEAVYKLEVEDMPLIVN